MKTLYQEIEHHLKQLDFSKLWEGFHLFPFALYNETQIILNQTSRPYDPAFRGNTAIKFEGEMIAIWYVTEEDLQTDSRILTSLLVHEMFHAYQKTEHETRFPDDLKLLNIPDHVVNYQLKQLEHQTIIQLLKQPHTRTPDLLLNLIALRTQREQLIGPIIYQEYLIETCEGMAEYVGLKALHQLSPTLYEEKIQTYLHLLEEPNDLLFQPRKMNYYTGSLILLALDEDLFKHQVGQENKTVFELIKEHSLIKKSWTNPLLASQLKSHQTRQLKEFENFRNQDLICYHGNYRICGYDPMNMMKLENQILCPHFICLKNQNTHEFLMIEGPILLEVSDDFEVTNYQTTLKKALQ